MVVRVSLQCRIPSSSPFSYFFSLFRAPKSYPMTDDMDLLCANQCYEARNLREIREPSSRDEEEKTAVIDSGLPNGLWLDAHHLVFRPCL